MKKRIALITGLSLLCIATPFNLGAAGAGAGHGKLKERVLEKFDENHNGVLDPDEKAAAKKALKERRAKMISRFDTNGDGTLDADEKAAARSELKKSHHKRQGKTQTPAARATQAK